MSDTIPFRDGVDFALDLADSLGGKVTSMMVADCVIGGVGGPELPGVVDLHVTILKRRELPLSHIKLDFEVFSTTKPCPTANPAHPPDHTPHTPEHRT